MLGCPYTWNGSEVPLPRLTGVASKKQVDGYKYIDFMSGKLGDGGIGSRYFVWWV